MIDKKKLDDYLAERLENSGYFVVETSVSPENRIVVEIEAEEGGADIDFCVGLSRDIQEVFDRDVEDYELEVGSAGLTSPFKVRKQFDKNIGNKVEVLGTDGKKYRGQLVEVNDDGFTIDTEQKVKHEGQKRPVMETVPVTFRYAEARKVQQIPEFQ